MGSTRTLIVLIAIFALILVLLIRPAIRASRPMHGPEYLWHRYLTELEDEKTEREQAAVASQKARQEEELAARSESAVDRENHKGQAASWQQMSRHHEQTADLVRKSATHHLKSYQKAVQ